MTSKYYGGWDWDKWYDRIMTATAAEMKVLRKQMEERRAAIELADKVEADFSLTPKQGGETKVHPRVVVESDWEGT